MKDPHIVNWAPGASDHITAKDLLEYLVDAKKTDIKRLVKHLDKVVYG